MALVEGVETAERAFRRQEPGATDPAPEPVELGRHGLRVTRATVAIRIDERVEQARDLLGDVGRDLADRRRTLDPEDDGLLDLRTVPRRARRQA